LGSRNVTMALLILHVLQSKIKSCDNMGSLQSDFIKKMMIKHFMLLRLSTI